MLEKVLGYIKKHDMLDAGHRVVVGVSGGADSLALIHLLEEMRSYIPMTLYVAHVNHGLRGQAAREDANFVKEFARELGLEFFLKEARVSDLSKKWGVSEEQAGRRVRYEFFGEVLDKVEGHRIALAHHKDDQAETILHNIIRGTGLAGLSGIRPIRDGHVIRPLLEISRQEIVDYCHAKGLSYRDDHTNDETIYTRNRIRHLVIPMIEEDFNPNFTNSLVRMGEILRDEEDFLLDYTNKVFANIAVFTNNKVKVLLSDFKECHKAIQARLIRHGLELLKKDLMGIEHVHIEGVLSMALNSHVGATLDLPGGYKARNDYKHLILYKAPARTEESTGPTPDFQYELSIPGEVLIPQLGIGLSVREAPQSSVLDKGKRCIYIDADAVGGQLLVRNRRNGDRFKPLGMTGSKKLKDFFIDNKIPRDKRDSIPLVVDRNNIIWIAEYQMSDDYKISKKTRKTLRLELIDL
ncbi:MAG: tRNA lysidine(34) synthetase TilS [Clostridiales bacterium]|nr:tRNA lysidine(34) synthetase TilS [Clostridiales bacterium]